MVVYVLLIFILGIFFGIATANYLFIRSLVCLFLFWFGEIQRFIYLFAPFFFRMNEWKLDDWLIDLFGSDSEKPVQSMPTCQIGG